MAWRKPSSKTSFAGIPRDVIRHSDYQSLSGNAVKLLLDLSFQYRGSNNGDLTTAYSVLKERGWKSRATIDRAKKELLDARLIIETRAGRFMNPGGRCSLYALTWLPVHDCPNKHLEHRPTTTPLRRFVDDKGRS
ncbi:MAG: hypothetical protein O3C68_08580 [Proteobacteria bacterium]|nr:hypothetical protein [Pseudomonadota bacterium]